MSNLSELLPSGGGQNAVDFVASGTLSSGQAVALKSDGTVEAISQTTGDVTNYTEAQMATNAAGTSYVSAKYDSFNENVVCLYLNTSNYPTIVVGEVSGNAISFGTPVVTASNTASDPVIGIQNGQYANGKGVVFYTNASALLTYGQFTVTGTTVTNTGGHNFTGEYVNAGTNIGYSPSTAEWLVTYVNQYTGYLEGRLISAGGSSPNVGSAVQRTTASDPKSFGISWDSSQSRFLVCIRYANQDGYAVTANTNGSLGLSWGSTLYSYGGTNSHTAEWQRVAYDSNTQKHLIVFSSPNDSDNLYGQVATLSGNVISFGTSSAIYTGTQYGSSQYDVAYDSDQGRMLVTFRKNDGPSSQYIFSVAVQLSGTSFNVGTDALIRAGNAQFITNTYNVSAKRVISSYEEVGGTNQPFAIASQIATSNFTDFIGITASAIANTATGSVNTFGGINEAQSGLTIAADYYVQNNGTLSTTASSVKVGQAISATTINMKDLT